MSHTWTHLNHSCRNYLPSAVEGKTPAVSSLIRVRLPDMFASFSPQRALPQPQTELGLHSFVLFPLLMQTLPPCLAVVLISALIQYSNIGMSTRSDFFLSQKYYFCFLIISTVKLISTKLISCFTLKVFHWLSGHNPSLLM